MKLEELAPVTRFSVPPLDPRVKLYFGRSVGQPVQVQGYVDRRGASYASLAVYFGSVLFFNPGNEGLFEVFAGCLGDGGEDVVLRADYAYDGASKSYLLLRAGYCGQAPMPYDSLPRDAADALERAVAEHMSRPFAEVKLDRSERYADEGALFDGESRFVEGLIGFGEVPVPIRGELEDVTCNGLDAVGLSDAHDPELLRELVRDFAKEAHSDGLFYAGAYERWLFGTNTL